MKTDEVKLKKCHVYLNQLYEDLNSSTGYLMNPQEMHRGFFRLGINIAELSAFLDEVFPEIEEVNE